MDPSTTTPSDQTGDIDPLELEDQTLPNEEVGELAHIEEDTPEADQKTVAEEQALVKAIDAVTAAVPEEDAPVAAKKSSHMIPRDLIDRELTFEDLYDKDRI